MNRLSVFALSLCFTMLMTLPICAQNPFDFSEDNSPFTEENDAKQRKRAEERARAAKLERDALDAKLKELKLEEQITLLRSKLSLSQDKIHLLEHQFNQKTTDLEAEQASEKKKTQDANKSLKETKELLTKRESILWFQSRLIHDLLAPKLTSDQPKEIVEGLKQLSALSGIDSISLYRQLVSDLAKSDHPMVRERAVELINSSFRDLAIETGYQSSKDFWLPVEAAKSGAQGNPLGAALGKLSNANSPRSALVQRSDFYFFETPLEEVVEVIGNLVGVSTTIDAAVDEEQYVDFEVKEVRLGDGLETILAKIDLAYSIQGNILSIVPKGKESKATLTYRVDALLKDHTPEKLIELSKQVLGDDQPDRITTVNENCLIVVADEVRQRKFSSFLAKINAAR